MYMNLKYCPHVISPAKHKMGNTKFNKF